MRWIDHPCAEARRIYSSIEQTLSACYVCPWHGTKILCRQVLTIGGARMVEEVEEPKLGSGLPKGKLQEPYYYGE